MQLQKGSPTILAGRSQDTLYIAEDIIQHRYKPVNHPVNVLGGAGRYTAIIQAGAVNEIMNLLTQRFGIGQSDGPLSQINFTTSGGREQLRGHRNDREEVSEMEVRIIGGAKEIAALVAEIQGQRTENALYDYENGIKYTLGPRGGGSGGGIRKIADCDPAVSKGV